MTKASILKVAQRDSRGITTGLVYVLESDSIGHTFMLQEGEFGKIYSASFYKRLPLKVRNLFN